MDALFSKTVKSGKNTYFFDIKEAKNGSKYLTLTASSPSKDEPQKFTKRSFIVFSNAADAFVEGLQEAVGHMKQ